MCIFYPSYDMRLSMEEVQVCAYVHNIIKPPEEVEFVMGKHLATRGDFKDLHPNSIFDTKVIFCAPSYDSRFQLYPKL